MEIRYCGTVNSRQRWRGERSTAESREVVFRATSAAFVCSKLFLDRPVEERGVTLSAQAAEFQPRRAAADTRQRIAAIAQEESQED